MVQIVQVLLVEHNVLDTVVALLVLLTVGVGVKMDAVHHALIKVGVIQVVLLHVAVAEVVTVVVLNNVVIIVTMSRVVTTVVLVNVVVDVTLVVTISANAVIFSGLETVATDV